MNAVSKNKIFDIRLFRESFRQLKGLALLFTGVILVPSLISLLSNPLSAGNTYVPRSVSLLSPMDMQPLLILSFCLAAPFLTLKAFRYTTERKGSDFYHALPHKRSCIFLSLLGSVFAWLVLILLVSALVSGLTAALFPRYYSFNWGDLLHMNLSILLVCFYVAVVTACAIHLSGTVFSNVIVSLLLLFGPRFIIHSLTQFIALESPLLMRDYLPFPYGINLFSHLVYTFFGGGVYGLLYDAQVYDWFRMIYTLFAVAAWVLFGVFLAQKRKSEWAEVPVAHGRIRAVIRTALAFIVCLIPLEMLLARSENTFDIMVFYLLALLLFFGYELLATRSIKSLGKILPSLLVLLALNLGAFLLCRSTIKSANAYQPEPEDIEYIRILDDKGSMSILVGAIQDCKLKDKEVHRLVSALLQKSRDNENRRGIYYGYRDNMVYQKVAIKSGLLERYRRLYIDRDDLEKLSQALTGDADYVAAYMNLPELEQLNGKFRLNTNLSEVPGVPQQIYLSLREEVQEMGFARWYQHQNKQITDAGCYLMLETNRRGIHTYSEFYIDEDLPKTLALYQMNEENFNQSQKELLDKQLKAWVDKPDQGHIYLQLNDFHNQRYAQNSFLVLPENADADYIQYMKSEGAVIIKTEQLQKLLDGLSQMNLAKKDIIEAGVWVDLEVNGGDIQYATARYVAEAVPAALEELFRGIASPQWGR